MKEHIKEYTSQANQEPNKPETKETTITPVFSFFKRPITNSNPIKDITLIDAYKAITSDYYKLQTELANQGYLTFLDTGDKKPYSQIKTSQFDYCTFSGTFSQRADKSLINHSGLYCLDSDHVHHARELINQIICIDDPYFEVELCFRSMSYFGVKWVISLKNPQPDQEHTTTYKGLQSYIKQKYNIETDNTSEVSRACFLSHDPKAFINPKYLI
ncbi:MAG: virulence protein E [Bacteroidetes bacterium]|nr:virulence protein E [Bacteroidota bacterium]